MIKSIQKILSIFPNFERDPFFILNPDGKITYSNKPGLSLLHLGVMQGSITDHFDSVSRENFNKLLDKLFERNELLIVEQFEINLTSGEKLNTEIRLNTIEQGKDLFVLCTIIPNSYKISFAEINRINSIEGGAEEIVINADLLKIITKVKALYPITFIGREVIHKLIDQLDEVFWVTDADGNLLIANTFFTECLGLKNNLAEGKSVLDFLPGYLSDFHTMVCNYIKNTLNCVAIDGVYFREIQAIKQKQIVQIPLTDGERNLCAFIGFSQQTDETGPGINSNKNIEEFEKILDNFPRPVAFITNTGIIKHYSDDFYKILKHKPAKLHGLKFADVLPKSLVDSIQRFTLSPDELRILPVNKDFEIARNDEHEYTVYLSKLLYKEDQPERISILFEKIEYAENLQHLIKSRGRMFEYLIENNPEPIFIYDKETLQFLEANQAALDLYGYSKDEFLQMDLTDLYNPEDIQTLLGSASEKENEGKFSKPYRHKRKDGSSVYVEISRTKFTFNERDAQFNIVNDVTQRLELLKNNQLFKAAFDNSSNIIIVTDPDGIITFVNNAAVTTLGFKKSELEKASLASLAEDEDRLTINTTIFQSYLAEPVELNIKLKSCNENVLDTEISATPVLDFEGSIESFVIIGKVVELPVGEVETEDIPQEKIETTTSSDTSQLQTAFLSGVFHEILTPMNVILGFAQELTEGIENLSPDQKEAVEIINQNRGKLLSTMNAIIEYSEIQKNKDEWEISELTITKVVEEIDRDIFEITGSKEINFAYGKISSSLQFKTDKKKFDCLVNNLLRLICRLISENKVYFSAYQVENNNFMIMISDNYSSVSEGLADTLKKLFVDKKDPKELGIPKLGVQIVQSLTELLDVKFVSSVDDSGKAEAGFLFPVEFDPHQKQSNEIQFEKDSEQPDVTEEVSVKEENLNEIENGYVSEQFEEEFVSGESEIEGNDTEQLSSQEDELIQEKLESSITEDQNKNEKASGIENEEEPELKSKPGLNKPEILSSPANKFDAIDFVSSVDDSPSENNSEDDHLVGEPTSVTDNINEPLSPEEESDKEEFTSEPEFEPLSSHTEEKFTGDIPIQEESSFDSEEGTEIPDITEIPMHQDFIPDEVVEEEAGAIETPPPDSSGESFEENNLINRQAFTFEEAAGGKLTSSDDKLDLHGLSCLYIEDQVDSQILFKVQMKGLKDIKYAVSFEDALPLLETDSFDFIVMDINLQGEYNGLDALKIIHKMPKYADVPIIAVTAYVLPGDKEKFIATGFNDFISKPIFREKMVESLEKIFLQKA